MPRDMPYMQFFVGDWLNDPCLRLCSPATRGIWIDLLCMMHLRMECKITASVEALARACGCSPTEMASALRELGDTKTAECNVLKRSGNEAVTVMSRRLERDQKTRLASAERVKRHREREKREGCNTDVTPTRACARSRESQSQSQSQKEIHGANTHSPSPVPLVATNGHAASVRAEGSGQGSDGKHDLSGRFAAHRLAGVYGVYPRQQSRSAAIAAIDRAACSLADSDNPPGDGDVLGWLVERVKAFRDSPAGKQGRYTPTCATWMDDGRFHDDPASWSYTNEPTPQTTKPGGGWAGVKIP